MSHKWQWTCKKHVSVVNKFLGVRKYVKIFSWKLLERWNCPRKNQNEVAVSRTTVFIGEEEESSQQCKFKQECKSCWPVERNRTQKWTMGAAGIEKDVNDYDIQRWKLNTHTSEERNKSNASQKRGKEKPFWRKVERSNFENEFVSSQNPWK